MSDFDAVSYVKTLLSGFLHPGIALDIREMNYVYFLESGIKILGLENVLEDVQNKYSSENSIPSVQYLSTTYPIQISLFNDIIAVNTNTLANHSEYRNLVDTYYNFYSKEHKARVYEKASELAKENPVNADRFLQDNIDVRQRTVQTISEFDVKNTYDDTFSKNCIFAPYIRPLDDAIDRFIAQGLLITLGFTSHGKTTLAMNLVYTSVVFQKANHAVLSLEMTKRELLYRLILRHSLHEKFEEDFVELTLNEFLFNRMNDEQKYFILDIVWEDFKQYDNKLFILDHSDFDTIDPFEVENRLILIDKKCGKLHAITVDYIQLFARLEQDVQGTRKKTNTEIIAEWSRWFQKLTKRFANHRGLFVNLLTQVKDSAWKEAVKNKGKYSMSSSGESGEVEKAADYVCICFVDEELKANKSMQLQLLKNRQGYTVEEPFTIAWYGEKFYAGDFAASTEELSLEDLGLI